MLTFPAPTAAQIELAKTSRGQAIGRYRDEAIAILTDGREVRPTLRTAKNAIVLAIKGIVAEVLVVEGGYSVVDREAERLQAEADRVRAERFVIYCAQEVSSPKGPTYPRPAIFSRPSSDFCPAAPLARVETRYHYAPDALGFPTPVMAECRSCAAREDAAARARVEA